VKRRVLIVGGSGVLGAAAARHFSSLPYELWLTARTDERRTGLAAAFPAAHVSQLDLQDPAGADQLMAQVKRQWGAIDLLVNAAGVGALLPLPVQSDDAWARLIDVNLTGALRLCRAAFPLLQVGKAPAVVLFSSTMGLVGAGGMAAYSACKGAVASLTRSLAIEWSPRGIRVNAVAPGIVPSPLVDAMFKRLTPEQVEQIRQRHPLGFGEAGDVAHAVEFLGSAQARWVTGVVLPVDGGYSAQ
jgi:NAD(P)-dependent dehydrogenase (short-subunit alcohol dehydrogenase family)